MLSKQDEHWMRMAVDVARSKGSGPSSSPFGCAIVRNDKAIAALSFIADAYHNDIEIEGGCLRADCAELYYPPGADLPDEEQANT